MARTAEVASASSLRYVIPPVVIKKIHALAEHTLPHVQFVKHARGYDKGRKSLTTASFEMQLAKVTGTYSHFQMYQSHVQYCDCFEERPCLVK